MNNLELTDKNIFELISEVCINRFGVKESTFRTRCRKRENTDAKAVLFKLARDLTGFTLKKCALKHREGYDHSDVSAAIKRYKVYYLNDLCFKHKADLVIEDLNQILGLELHEQQ